MPHQMTKHFAEGFPKRLFSQRKRILPLRNRRISADAQPVKKDTGTHLHITQRKSIKPPADRKTREEAHENAIRFFRAVTTRFPGVSVKKYRKPAELKPAVPKKEEYFIPRKTSSEVNERIFNGYNLQTDSAAAEFLLFVHL